MAEHEPEQPDREEQDTPVPSFVGDLMDEPEVAPDDTQPRAPVAPPDASQLMPPAERLAAEEPPRDTLADTAEMLARLPASPARAFLLVAVMLITTCMCAMMIGFASIAGYRDGLATNDYKVTQTLATGIAEQYAEGVADLDAGYAELAAARFSWIVEALQAPTEFARDSAEKLALARTMAAYTPTSPPTSSPTPNPSPTAPPSPTLVAAETPGPTLNPANDPGWLYEQAATAMRLARFEDAIEWLDALRALAPDYRPAEAEAMLMEALTQQGDIYLDGANPDGEDQLMRGVQLVYRAAEMGEINSLLLGQAIFVERYVLARNYVNGGSYAAALPILEELCAQNCQWGYPNWDPVTVEDLLNQTRSGE